MDQIKDMLDTARDSLYELWDSLVDRVPILANLQGQGVIIASGAAILGALVCVIMTLGTNRTAAALEGDAANYKAGQAQLNAVLGDSVDVGFSDADKEVIGRSGLVLQYKKLADLPSESGINKMKNNLGIGDSQTEKENASYDSAMSQKIKAFAGDYGGSLVVPGTIGTNSLKIAAYSSDTAMSAHDSSEGTVSNVLYEKINRTIENTNYGEADTKNTLIFLSASKINGLSSVSEGSTMYTLFGDEDSTGSKDTAKYICTGKETGTYLGVSLDGETDPGYLDSEEEVTTTTYEDESADEAGTEDLFVDERTEDDEDDNEFTVIDSTASIPMLKTDVTEVNITGDDIVEGEQSYNSDGTVNEEYTEKNDNGTVSSAMTNADDGISAKSKTSVHAVKIFDTEGNALSDNKTADLIMYEYNKTTGSVTITYWNLAGSDAANKALAEAGTSTTSTDSDADADALADSAGNTTTNTED